MYPYNDDTGFCIENAYFFQKTGFQDYRDTEDDVNEHDDPSCKDLGPTCDATGSLNQLRDYFARFLGWDEDKFSNGYDALDDRFNGLNMGNDLYRNEEWCDGYGSSNKEIEMQSRAEERPWFCCDFGSQYGVDEDYGTTEVKSRYSQCSEYCDELGLYEKIFGNWHSLLRPDMESMVEAGPA